MLAIELTVNILLLVGMALLCFGVGFLSKQKQIKSLRRKILELETEMLSNHADILDLQKQKATLEQTIRQTKIPVIPINSTKEDAEIKGRKNTSATSQ